MGCFARTFWLVVAALIAWPYVFSGPEPSWGGGGPGGGGGTADPAPSGPIVPAEALQDFVRKDRDELPAGSEIRCPSTERTLGEYITCRVVADGEEWTVRVEMVERADGSIGAAADPPQRF